MGGPLPRDPGIGMFGDIPGVRAKGHQSRHTALIAKDFVDMGGERGSPQPTMEPRGILAGIDEGPMPRFEDETSCLEKQCQ